MPGHPLWIVCGCLSLLFIAPPCRAEEPVAELKRAIEDLQGACQSSDFERWWDLIHEDARRELLHRMRIEQDRARDGAPDARGFLTRTLDRSLRKSLRMSGVRGLRALFHEAAARSPMAELPRGSPDRLRVDVSDDRAEVDCTGALGRPMSLNFCRQDGRWRLTGPIELQAGRDLVAPPELVVERLTAAMRGRDVRGVWACLSQEARVGFLDAAREEFARRSPGLKMTQQLLVRMIPVEVLFEVPDVDSAKSPGMVQDLFEAGGRWTLDGKTGTEDTAQFERDGRTLRLRLRGLAWVLADDSAALLGVRK